MTNESVHVQAQGAAEPAAGAAGAGRTVPWRAILPVLVPASAILMGIVAVQRFTHSIDTLRLLDNLHWTLCFAAGAALAWIAVRHGAPERASSLRWYALGMTGYAAGQVLWDVQVTAGWNPFPAPSDALFLMLGTCCSIGIAHEADTCAHAGRKRLVGLDAGSFAVAALTLVLALYLPLRGNNSVLQIAVLVAYPLGLLTAACIGTMMVPALRLRADAGWLLFVGGLALSGALWMEWNAMTLSGRLADGTLFNACFSVMALVLGVGVCRWNPVPIAHHKWERRYEGLLRLLPLAAVVGASGAVIVAFTIPHVPHVVQRSIAYGAAVVLILAFGRQSVLLHERDRMLEVEGKFRTLFDSAPDAILLMDADRFIDCNASAERLFGLPRAELCGMIPAQVSPETQPDGRASSDRARTLVEAALAGEPQSFEWRHLRAGAGHFDTEVTLHRVDLPGRTLLQAVVRDVTERCEAEATRQRLEEQLRQASRMEAVGRLAGGIAHDFNNILTVILGTSELALVRLPAGDRMRRDVEEIRRSAQRAAALTSQLLAFSRKRAIAPLPTNLNTLVTGALAMLRRLIGEDVELVFEPAESLATVMMDRAQFEQVLLNLAVNARDAMAGGGRLVIATGEGVFTEASLGEHTAASPGRYVRLDVSDDGVGIPPELIEHVFEPFFTTKEFGLGTGIGLSTVYGIVRQSGGFIELRSAPGTGTRFSLFFPAVPLAPQAVPAAEPESRPGGSESILLVEDETLVRELAGRLLAGLGYTVNAAAGGQEALEIAARPGMHVDLLLTDVVMPGMSGRQLHDRLVSSRPGLRVVFMSGYTANILGPHGVLGPDITLLQKPFSIGALADTVRGALDRPAAAPAAPAAAFGQSGPARA